MNETNFWTNVLTLAFEWTLVTRLEELDDLYRELVKAESGASGRVDEMRERYSKRKTELCAEFKHLKIVHIVGWGHVLRSEERSLER